MSTQKEHSGGQMPYSLVFACSGAADVGAIADQAARKLSQDKTASMCCTAAIAAEIPDILDKAKFASKVVIIDGCEKACVKKIFDDGGFTGYAHVELEASGMEKGKTPPTEENILRAAAMASEALAGKTSE